MSEERLYTPNEAGRELGVSDDTVRRLVRDRPGVIHLGGPHRDWIRIPQRVLDELWEEMSQQ